MEIDIGIPNWFWLELADKSDIGVAVEVHALHIQGNHHLREISVLVLDWVLFCYYWSFLLISRWYSLGQWTRRRLFIEEMLFFPKKSKNGYIATFSGFQASSSSTSPRWRRSDCPIHWGIADMGIPHVPFALRFLICCFHLFIAYYLQRESSSLTSQTLTCSIISFISRFSQAVVAIWSEILVLMLICRRMVFWWYPFILRNASGLKDLFPNLRASADSNSSTRIYYAVSYV